MAEESGVGLCNALIMMTARAPFVRRWMEKYRSFDDLAWNKHSVLLPYQMYADGDPDIAVLDDHAWFYPMYGRHKRGLKMMWFGKSWWDIDRNYGVHFWKWSESLVPDLLTPETVREIDTPLFCAMRKIFDDAYGGVVSMEPGKNPNCSIPETSNIVDHFHGLFAVYDFSTDGSDRKWVDRSGNNLHGWALSDTNLTTSYTSGSSTRFFDENSYAVLPVPLGWDARVGSINAQFKFDITTLSYGQAMLLVKTSINDNDAIMIRLEMGDEGQQYSRIELIWTGAGEPSAHSYTILPSIHYPQSLLHMRSG